MFTISDIAIENVIAFIKKFNQHEINIEQLIF